MRSDAHSTRLLEWQYLTTGMTFRAPELDASVHGLNLPESVGAQDLQRQCRTLVR